MSDKIPGSSWSNPIWYGKWRIAVNSDIWPPFVYAHDDFDGASDGHDQRSGFANTIAECKAEIDQIEAILEEEAREEAAAHGQFGVGA